MAKARRNRSAVPREGAPVAAAGRAAAIGGGPLEKGLALALLAAFVVAVFIVVRAHEPWRDEAEFWLAARDLSWIEIFTRGGYVGTPPLWTLVLTPFARLGLPYETLGIVNLLLAAGAAGLLLLAAPFPLPLRALFAFSYFFSFEYAVIARSYALGAMLIFARAALDAHPGRHRVGRGVALALLFQTSVHGMALGFPLLALDAWQAWRERGAPVRGTRPGLAVAAASAVLAVVQILPHADGQLQGGSMAGGLRWAPITMTAALLPALEEVRLAQLGAGLVVLATLVVLRPRPRLFLLGSSALLLAIFVLKYRGDLRHWGYLLVALIVALWMSRSEERAEAAATAGTRSATRLAPPVIRVARAVSTWGIAAAMGWSVFFAWGNWDRDFHYPFSEARAMARYLKDAGLDRSPILGWPAPHAAAVLAHLPKRRFYYPGIRDSGSCMRWDRAYELGLWIADDELLRRSLEAYPGRSDVLLLVNRPIEGAEAAGFVPIHAAHGTAMVRDERFLLYRRGAGAAADSARSAGPPLDGRGLPQDHAPP